MLSTLLVISEEGISGRPNNGAESNCTNGGRVSSSFCLGLLNYMHSPHGLSSESLGLMLPYTNSGEYCSILIGVLHESIFFAPCKAFYVVRLTKICNWRHIAVIENHYVIIYNIINYKFRQIKNDAFF